MHRFGGLCKNPHLWEQAEHAIHSIGRSDTKAEALSELGRLLAQAQQLERAENAWSEAQWVILTLVELTEIIAWENASSKFNRALRIPSQQLWKRGEEARVAEEGEKRSQGER